MWLEPLSTLHFDESKLRKSALSATSFLLLPSPPSITALADWHAPHKPYKHFHFPPYMMALSSLNFLSIYRQLAALLCSVPLLVTGLEAGGCPGTAALGLLGLSALLTSLCPWAAAGRTGTKDSHRCQVPSPQLWPSLPNVP